jgi:hypothetical protein
MILSRQQLNQPQLFIAENVSRSILFVGPLPINGRTVTFFPP